MINSLGDSEFALNRLLFVRGDKSLGTIPNLLADKAVVDEIVVYETRELRPAADLVRGISERLGRGDIGWICFFSPSAVESFRRLFALAVFDRVKTAAIGETTGLMARELEMHVDFISDRATVEDFAAGLIAHIKSIE